MKPEIAAKLRALNAQFYQTFGLAFATTRRRLQPGILRILPRLPLAARWLDLGCAHGEIARWLVQHRFQGHYLGLDFSPVLLAEAQAWTAQLKPDLSARFTFHQADLGNSAWIEALEGQQFDVVLAFAVLHHIPGQANRLRLLAQVRTRLHEEGYLVLSVWQFQNSPRLLARRQSWAQVGIDPADLEPGDTLLDWRHTLPDQPENVGLRYVHQFDRQELAALASASGFYVEETFESDGEGGRLGLYQIWRPD
ncbi:class I SAM-dependent methyltransferase [uncultured Thermanaerothrix sp.]|uniref:class I SAM-dependent methyltransferase n=1 Tax=uncultured Thermanaerothrix sp. TaxID=1195149 RepID=UPI00262BE1EE|nr:class I SAM-dependent methyltransferase [uncultured Thermanaerothrix sp.]